MTEKIAIISLGCNKNLVDSEIMTGFLLENGFLMVNEAAIADVIIVNTCGFIESAKKEAIDTIFEMAQYKKQGNCKALIVTGCLAKRYTKQLAEDMPEADAILGVYDYSSIAQAVKNALAGIRTIVDNGKAEYLDTVTKRVISTSGGMAYLKIAEGCDNHCAYCAIPSIRGNYTSRSMASLLAEAKLLNSQGVTELVLTAQDTTRYGEDRGNNEFLLLLKELSRIDFEWIRVLYAYPSRVTSELLEFMDSAPNICKYLDIPIQHSSDKMLSAMNRHYNNKDLVRIIKKIRSFENDWALRTTVICGFPTETTKEFTQLLHFISEYPFDSLGAFAFSREEGTPAALMPSQCREGTAQARQDSIMLRQGEIVHSFNKRRIGKTYKTLVEGFDSEQNSYFGRTYFLAPEVDGKVFFTSKGELNIGDYKNIMISDAFGHDFFGECKDELS